MQGVALLVYGGKILLPHARSRNFYQLDSYLYFAKNRFKQKEHKQKEKTDVFAVR